MTCRDGRHYGDNYLGAWDTNRSVCCFIPPASVAKALGLESGHDLEWAYTHPDWSCDLWQEVE